MRIIFLLFITALVCSCGQNTSTDTIKDGYTLNPAIKEEVEKNIGSLPMPGTNIMVFENKANYTVYESDTVVVNRTGTNHDIFKSFYYWNKEGDTLRIDGAFGLFGGFGFTVEVIKGKATLYHMLASDEFPSYAYKEKDSLVYRLQVPCTDTKIVLSEVPDSTKKPVIYGYVEFKSKEYFSSNGTMNDIEMLPRKKMRMDMKVYFKSGFLDF